MRRDKKDQLSSAFYWHAAVAGLTLFLMYFVSIFWVFLGLIWLPFAIPVLRHKILSGPCLRFFQKNIPSMSSTEREAIEAGDVWWEGELVSGAPNWSRLLAYPKPALTKEEQAFLDKQVETLCSMLDDWSIMISESQDLPEEIWAYLKRERFFGMVISKAYGGLGFSAFAHSTAIMKIATRSPTAAITAMVPNSLGPGELLYLYGTDEQKQTFLPRLASGEDIPCFALTGLEAGSDAAAMTDTGIICRGKHEGAEVLGIRLNFNKRYITLAPVATLVGLAFKLYDPDHLLGEKENIGITLAIMPTSHPGVEVGGRHRPMFLPFMNGPVRGKDVFIPLDWVIGGKAYCGKGWRMLMECLSIGRSISLPAISTAAGTLSYRMTGAYAALRKQFKVSIGQFEGVEASLARVGGLTYLLEACRCMTAGAVDLGVKPAIASAIAKYHMTEIFRQVVNDAMDIHAGRAVQSGPRNYLTGIYLGIPVSITVEGANILTRNLIIFGQGLIRCHPYLLDEIHMAQNPNVSPALFDKTMIKHMGHFVCMMAKSIWGGLTGGRFFSSPRKGFVAKYYRQLTRMSAVLAFVSEVALVFLGASLKRKERLSARLGDVLSYLYLASAVLKQYNDAGQITDERASVRWACEYCLSQIQYALQAFFHNFPSRWMGILLKRLIFPWGMPYHKPSDQLDHEVVSPMLSPSALRARLTQHVYLGRSKNDITGRLDEALTLAMQVSDIEQKFNAALKRGQLSEALPFQEQIKIAVKLDIITSEEAARFDEFYRLRQDVLAVDEFE